MTTTSIHGRRLGLKVPTDNLVARGINISQPCVDATITVSAEGATVANQRDISITLKDARGAAINYAEMVELIVFSSSAMTNFTTTGGTTGIAAGASGYILALVAKKVFRAISTTAGVIAVIYTDTGTDAAYLGVRLPNGRIVAGGTLTTA
jgi:hypothetical protein